MDEWIVWNWVGFSQWKYWEFYSVNFLIFCFVVVICVERKIGHNQHYTPSYIKNQPPHGHNRPIRCHNERVFSNHPRNPTPPTSIKICIKNQPHLTHNIHPHLSHHRRLCIILRALLLHKNEYKVTKGNLHLYWWVIVERMGHKFLV